MLPLAVQVAVDYWRGGERTLARMQGLITHMCDTYCVQGEERKHYIELALEQAKRFAK